MANKKEEEKKEKAYALNSRSDKRRNLPGVVAPERTEAQKEYWGQGQSLLAPKAAVAETPKPTGNDWVKDITSLMDKMGDETPDADKLAMATSVLQEREAAKAQEPIDQIYKGTQAYPAKLTGGWQEYLGRDESNKIDVPYYFNTGAAEREGLDPTAFAKKHGINNLSLLGGYPIKSPPTTTGKDKESDKKDKKPLRVDPKASEMLTLEDPTAQMQPDQGMSPEDIDYGRPNDGKPLFKAPDTWTAPTTAETSRNQEYGTYTQGKKTWDPIKSFKELLDDLFKGKRMLDKTQMGGMM